MSRIGRLPIVVPAGIDVTIDGREVQVKGPKGTLHRTIAEPITIKQEGDRLIVESDFSIRFVEKDPYRPSTKSSIYNLFSELC